MRIHLSIFTLIFFLSGLAGCSDNTSTSTDSDSDSDTVATLEHDSPADSEDAGDEEEGSETGNGGLPLAAGMIEYHLSGIHSGTITKYWRKHGLEMAEYHDTTMNMMGIVQTDKKWTIIRPDGVYTIKGNTATKVDNPTTAMTSGMSRNDMQSFGKKMLEQMGKRTGEKEIAGKTCELWTMTMGTEVCMWEGMDIYSSGGMGGGMNMTRTAVKIEIGEPDEKHFKLPEGVSLKEMGNPLDWGEQMKRAQEFMPKQ